jgi:uncharacterized protein with ATP-grasp and redox domains
MAQLPPVLRTSEPGSFAEHTFKTRIPHIVNEVIALNNFPMDVIAALQTLRDEIVGGALQPIRESAADAEYWNASAAGHIGKTWLDLPWYWAEAFFYRRVLEATHYFQPGSTFHLDPYAADKQTELQPERAPATLLALLAYLPADLEQAFHLLLHTSLWGNRVDLSMKQVAQNMSGPLSIENERANLLVDDTTRVWTHLQNMRGKRVDFICDNTGTELLCDLALADWVLHSGLAGQIVFHLKPQPFFVSDATIQDVNTALNTLGSSALPLLNQLAQRLVQAKEAGRLVLTDYAFWATGSFFHDMPTDLKETLGQAALVISKGDANYRRLVGDCHWDPTTPFAKATGYFPSPVVALRTLKAELIVGLRPGEAKRLQAQGPAWLTSGKHGVVQFS